MRNVLNLVLLIMYLLVNSCSNTKIQDTTNLEEVESKSGLSDMVNNESSLAQVKTHERQEVTLDGIWARDPSENAWFIIKNDSVFDIDRNGTPIVLKGDTLIVNDEDYQAKFLILKLTADSLIIKDELAGITRLYKR